MDSNKIKTVSTREAQDGWQKDQNGKLFIYLMCYFIFSSYMGNNQCYLLVVLPGATSGLPLVVRNALNHGKLLCSTKVSYLYLYLFFCLKFYRTS